YLKENEEEYKTVVLDHVTGFQDLVQKEILGLEEIPVVKNWGLATQQDYGQCVTQCKELLRALLSLNQNVVVIAQEREFNVDSDDKLLKPFVASGLTPSLLGWLNTAVDYICQTYIRPKFKIKKSIKNEGTK